MANTVTEDSVIHGERRNGTASVFVDDEPLDWEASLEFRNHSPTGPEWGYAGSGPSQLALAILLVFTTPVEAQRHYQDFKRAFIAPIEGDLWVISARDVRYWLAGRL